MSEETSLVKARISTLEGRIGALQLESEKIRGGLVHLMERVQDVISKRAGDTAVRKGLDIGDDYVQQNPRTSLEDAVLARASNPQISLNGTHLDEGD